MRILVENTEEKLAPQIAYFCSNYPTYKDKLNADETDMTNLNVGSEFMTFILGMQAKMQTASVGFTSYKDLMISGNGTDVLGALPVLVTYPAIVPPVCGANVESLFRKVLQQCVSSGNLTEDMAKALGIYAEPSVVVLEKGTPPLSLKSMSAGHPTLHSRLGDYDGFEIWKNTGAGFVFLNVSDSPNYTDTSALPAIGVGAIWQYKIIYRYKNVQIGNWSETISVAVTGSV